MIATDSPPAGFHDGNSRSATRATAIDRPTNPDSSRRQAALPVFVELPPQPQAIPVDSAPIVETPVARSPATESIPAPLPSSAGKGREAVIAPSIAAFNCAAGIQVTAGGRHSQRRHLEGQRESGSSTAQRPFRRFQCRSRMSGLP